MEKPKKPPRPYIDKEFPEISGKEFWFAPSPPSPSPYQNVEMREIEEIEEEERAELSLKQGRKRKGAPFTPEKQKGNQEPNLRVIKPKSLLRSKTNIPSPPLLL